MNDILTVQELLNKAIGSGLTEDGISGPATIAAIKQFQLQKGLLPDGRISAELISALKTATGSKDVVDTTNSPSFLESIGEFFNENKTPIIVMGSLGIFGYGVWFIKTRLRR
jgi:peptidoglycan hydrolase-like protein with peptidoglycan-binding domain